MKKINTYIIEKLKKINSKNIRQIYNYFPKNKGELKEIINKLIKERGDEADLNDIDTSEIEDMGYIFPNVNFNGDISEWNVSNVEDMCRMFISSKFTSQNGDISKWNVLKLHYKN